MYPDLIYYVAENAAFLIGWINFIEMIVVVRLFMFATYQLSFVISNNSTFHQLIDGKDSTRLDHQHQITIKKGVQRACEHACRLMGWSCTILLTCSHIS